MRLLLTGFEPFGGEEVNPSWEVANAVAGEAPPGVDVELLRLPVRGRISFARLIPAFEAGEFDAWLGLGEAGGRTHLSVERLGVNLLIDRAADGSALPEETLVEDGPAGHFARLPVNDLAAAIQSAGVPAQVSRSAGEYICNETLFVMMHHLERRAAEGAAPAGFLHLPYLPSQTVGKPAGTPSMALESQARGVAVAIEFVRDLVAAQPARERLASRAT